MSNRASNPPGTPEPRTAPSTEPVRFVSRSIDLTSGDPSAFLRLKHEGPRGFWARGGAWVAHLGAVATIRADGEPRASDRFERIRLHAQTLAVPGPLREPAPADAPVRFYGGFAFRDDQPDEGPWRYFPAAFFVLPELELEWSNGILRARARRALEPWESYEAATSALSDRLDSVRSALDASPAPASRRPLGAPLRAAPAAGEKVLWNAVVNDALRAIETGQVSKVVLARTLDVDPQRTLDPVDVLMALWADNPRTHVFLFEPTAGSPLLGAAPETVATVFGTSFHATAVAGSVPHGSSPEETAALAEKLLASRKDQLEHRIAVEDMVDRLQGLAADVTAEWEPHVITLSRIQHLETRIRARLPEGCTVLDALAALHPTPAVCGLPRDEALEFIHDEEPFDRGWYAGPVGWFDSIGNGVFAPALRCAVGHGRTWRLFAGAGIVAGSEPDLEWDETGIKFEPVLRALAANPME